MILVTNQLQFVHRADRVVHVRHDQVTQQAWIDGYGTFDQLMASSDFAEMMQGVGTSDTTDSSTSPTAADGSTKALTPTAGAHGMGGKGKVSTASQSVLLSVLICQACTCFCFPAALTSCLPQSGNKGGGLVDMEERATGVVSWDVYRGYLRLAQATSFFFGVVLLSFMAQCSSIFNDLWLSWWTEDYFHLPIWANNVV